VLECCSRLRGETFYAHAKKNMLLMYRHHMLKSRLAIRLAIETTLCLPLTREQRGKPTSAELLLRA